MPPRALNLPAPSHSLLRYLRAQSESLGFFEPSHGPSCAVSDIFRCPLRSSSNKLNLAPRALSVSRARKSADLQAGILNIDAIFPKFAPKQRATKTTPDVAILAGSRRYASDDHTPSALCKPSWHERLWGSQASSSASAASQAATPLKPDDLPSRDDMRGPGDIFNANRTQTNKAALEPRLRCTEVDENGEVIMVDGEFKKSELIAKVRRDNSWRNLICGSRMLTFLRFSMVCCLEIYGRLTPLICPISLCARRRFSSTFFT